MERNQTPLPQQPKTEPEVEAVDEQPSEDE
jgi:hypothetical protein